jgi:hypothetical protein
VAALLLAAALSTSAPSARAALEAHLYLDEITSIGSIGPAYLTDADDSAAERLALPTNQDEPYWHVAIFDVPVPPVGDFSPYASVFSDLTCANWSHTNTLVIQRDFDRVIPGGQTAWFYIGVFDYDAFPTIDGPGSNDTWLGELLGDHYVSGYRDALSTPEPNNNQSPRYLPGAGGDWCGVAPGDVGAVGNWEVRYRTYYRDTTPPTSATVPAHSDDDAPPGYNNDPILTFDWTPGGDDDSGIRQLIRIARASDLGWCELDLAPSQSSFDFAGTVSCAAGSLAALTLDEGEVYRASIRTRNGLLPVVENPAFVDSGDSAWVTQDSVPTAVPVLAPSGALLLGVALGLAASSALRRGSAGTPPGTHPSPLAHVKVTSTSPMPS